MSQNNNPSAGNDGSGTPVASISLGTLNGSTGIQITGAQLGSQAGGVTSIGDVNGDGYEDIMIGASQWDPGALAQENYGRVHVVFGSAGGFDSNIDLSTLGSTTPGFTIDGLANGNVLGETVSAVGDVNNDGVDDILIGARGADVGGINTGSAYVIYGKDSTQGDTFGTSVDLSTLDGSTGFTMNGEAAGDLFGLSTTSAGDVNGDGIDDLMVYAYGADPAGRNGAGKTYVVFGTNGDLGTNTLDLSALDGTNGFQIFGANAGDSDFIGGTGRHVASAGDVNGDGIDDLIVGMPGFDAGGTINTGAAYIVYGKQTSQPGVSFASTLDLASLGSTDGIRIEGPNTISHLAGFSVSAAGDVNGDGFGDVVVGARNFSAGVNDGAAVVFGGQSLGNLSFDDLDGTNGFRLSGVSGTSIGISAQGIGDFNGDGYDDIAIGSFTHSASAIGKAYIVFGKQDGFSADIDLSALDGTDGFRLDGVEAGDLAGRMVSAAGDLNNDGLDDVMIGAFRTDTGGNTDTGSAYVVYGENYRATEDAAVTIGNVLVNDTDVDGDDLTVTSVDAVSANGAAVTIHSSNGSFNYDPTGSATIQALAAGQTLTDTFTYTVSDGNGGTSTATVTVTVAGADEGNQAPVAVNDGDVAPPTSLSLGALDGSTGIQITGAPAGALAGSVTSLGDVNGDGHADFMVGAYVFDLTSDPNENFGRAYVIFGSADGFDSNIDLSTVGTTTAGFTVTGLTQSAALGEVTSFGGDLNNDGIDDIALYSRNADVGGTDTGSAYVIYGKDSTQGDTFGSSVDLATLNGSNGFTMNGEVAGDKFGLSTASAGDVNGDGIDDLMVYAQHADPSGRTDAGKAYVVFGTNGDLGTSTLDLSTLDGTNGFQVYGANANDAGEFGGTGRHVAGAGDVNGDGVDDLVIGMPRYDAGGLVNTGAAYIVYGKQTSQPGVSFSSTIDLATIGSSDGIRIDGPATASFQAGFSVSSAGDINGDGYGDVVIGSFDLSSGSNGGASVVFGGQSLADLSVADLDGTNGFRLSGAPNIHTGISVDGIGDFNGDGYDDLIIGSFAYPQTQITGTTYILFGKSGGFSADIDLSALDGTDGLRLDGAQTSGLAGRFVSEAGDLNADGLDDVLIGALRADTGVDADTGAAYLVYGSNYRATEDASVVIGNVLVNDTDVDGDDLTVTSVDAVSANGAAVTIRSSNGTFNYDPTGSATIQALADGQTMTDTFTYTISDGNGGTSTATVTVTIVGANDVPVVSGAVTPQTADEDAVYSFTLPAGLLSDIDTGDTLTLSATQSDGSALPAWLSFNPATGTFSGTPENDDVGVVTLKVTATDAAGEMAEVTFDLTVVNTNDAPVVSGSVTAQSTDEDAAFSYVLPVGLFSDVDVGDTLTLSATQADGSALPAWLSFDPLTGTFSGTPENGDVGVLAVKVIATDSASATADVTFDLTVVNTNDAPIVSGSVTAQSTDEDALFSFTLPAGLFTDVDAGDTLTLSATQADGSALPAWLSFDPVTGTFSGTPANGDVGVFSVKVTATDTAAATADVTFDLTVANTNDAPTVAVGLLNQSAEDGQSFLFTVPGGTFVDVDAGDQLVLTATQADGSALPSWLSFDPATGTFSGTPANGDVGVISLKVTATDGSLAAVSSSFDLTVNPPSGDDLLDGVVLQGVIDGGPGNDTITYAAAAAAVDVNLITGVGSGAEATGDSYLNIENATGSAFADTLTGDAGANTLTGLGGDDVLEGGAGADVLDGGDGVDTASYAASVAGVVVNLATGTALQGDAGGDTFISIENLAGSSHNDTLTGDAAANVIYGNNGDDSLFGGDGDDNLFGQAGADSIDGGAGTDVASYASSWEGVTVNLATGVNTGGTAAGDVLTSIENLSGSIYADTLTGDAGANTLWGWAGDDSFFGGDGADTIYGGEGSDSVRGGAGADILDGGAGGDVVWYDGSAAGVTVDLSLTTAQVSLGNAAGDILSGFENLGGSSHADTLSGDVGANVIVGGGGNDVIYGNNGDDSLFGDDGDDNLFGQAGADTIDGGAGTDVASYASSWEGVTVNLATGINTGGTAAGDVLTSIENLSGSIHADTLTGDGGANTLWGWAGDDVLEGGAGADALHGGDGTDTASYSGSDAGVVVHLGTGTSLYGDAAGDTFTGIENLTGSAYGDQLFGTAGSNVLSGGAANDLLGGGLGADVLDGGEGSDWAWYAGAAAGVQVDLLTGVHGGAEAVGDTLISIENLRGSYHGDTLTGDHAANVLDGLAGDDILYGNNGDDSLFGGDGNDNLFGQAGADTIDGGAGTDVASYASSWEGVTVNLATGVNTGGTAAGDVLTSIENLSGSIYADTLTGDAGANTLWGWAGDDSFFGGDGADTIYGGEGSDSVRGGAGADILDGGAGGDVVWYDGSAAGVTVDLSLTTAQVSLGNAAGDILSGFENLGGSAHADTLSGDAGANVIVGGGGNDIIDGNSGNDTLYGNNGDDSLLGSDGNDILEGGAGADHLDGGIGTDTASYSGSDAGVVVHLGTGTSLYGDAAGDTFTGIENLTGSAYGDQLYGTAAANVLSGGAADDLLGGGLGADVLDGGEGSDWAWYAGAAAGVQVNMATGVHSGADAVGDVLISIENLYGSFHNDTLTGDAGDNVLNGLSGADALDGGAGIDTADYSNASGGVTIDLAAGTGVGAEAQGDTLTNIENIFGSEHLDTILGDGLNNSIYGRGGNDHLRGQGGADTIDGGAGIDTANYDTSSAGVTVNLVTNANSGGDAEGDQLVDIENIGGSTHNDILTGDAGANTLWGNSGDDILEGGAGADHLDGGIGNDTASYAGSDAGVVVHLGTGTSLYGDAAGDTFAGIENLTGSAYGDQLYGTAAANVLSGGAADDLLGGGLGADVLDGGEGSDWAWYAGAAAGVQVNMATGVHSGADAVGDVLISIENLYGSFHNDTLTGDAGDNVLNGLSGADALDGGAGIDTADYSNASGGVTIDLAAGTGVGAEAQGDTLTNIENVAGSGHADILIGDAGNNTLWGNDGNDTMTGGSGNDHLEGRTGFDTYIFDRGMDDDIIYNAFSDSAGGVADFGASVDFDQLWLTQAGDDLILSIVGTTDTLTLDDFFGTGEREVTQIVANGATLDVSSSSQAAENLVTAMASFTPPPLGQLDLDPATSSDPSISTALSAWDLA